MTLAQVMLVAGKELRETLRDRRTLAVMVLFPLVVYPLVSLATVQVLTARIGRGEKVPARVAISGPQPLAEKLRARLAARTHDGNPDFALSLPPAPATAADVRAGRLDAAITVEKPSPDASGGASGGATGAATGAATARVLFDETQERSRTARTRIEEALAAGLEPGCTPSYAVAIEGVAPRTAMGGYLLSRILPLVIVVMVMLGAFHPAIDITAGERERSTLETTLSAPIPRSALMTGKVVAVATLATLSGVLNLASMSITVLEGAKLAAGGAAPSLPWANAGAAALLVIPPAAFLFASVMVAIGALARSFKEAQTLLTPVYFMCMAPALLAALGDFELHGAAAFIPGVGVTLLARDVIAGHASVAAIVAVFASSVGYGAAALALACRLYDSERLLGADDAGLGLRAWLRHLLFGPGATGRDEGFDPNLPTAPNAPNALNAPDAPPSAGHALALFGVAVLLLFAFLPIQKWRLVPGLALFEWVGLLGLTAVYARGSGRRWVSVLRLRKPSLAAVVGAILIGASAWLVVGLLVQWVLPPPKEVEEHIRRIIPSGEGKGGFTFAILLIAFTPAICEEALFRGPILRGLRTRLSALGAAVVTGLLFGLYHGDVWRFIPIAVLGFAFSAIALATDSIVPAMIAHFTNNACLIALARAGIDEAGSEISVRQRLTLVALGGVVLAAGAALIAHAHRTRRVRDARPSEGSGGQM